MERCSENLKISQLNSSDYENNKINKVPNDVHGLRINKINNLNCLSQSTGT